MVIAGLAKALALTLLIAALWSTTPAGAAGGGWTATWSADGHQVIALRGGKTTAAPARPRDVAAKFIAANAALLGLSTANFKLVSERTSVSGAHLTFKQLTNGLPVIEGAIDIHVNGNGQVFLVTSNAVTDADAQSLNVAAGISPAIAIARAATRGSGIFDKTGTVELQLPAAATPVLGLLRLKSGARLVYAVTAGPVTHYLDAATGAVLLTRSAILSATGRGRVFIPNPVHTLNNAALSDRNDADYPAVGNAYRIRDLKNIRRKNGRYHLRGPHVRTVDFSKSLLETCGFGVFHIGLPPKSRTDLKFKYNRSQPNFEHTMVYYTIDTSQRYIKSLGFANMLNTPVRVDAHALNIDNSFYCGSPVGAGFIAFGDGGVDDAEDADIVLHEYGHALQDAASNGKYGFDSEAGAMGEGFGDYWTYSPDTTPTTWANCFGEFDSEGTCWRRLDENIVYPAGYVGEVHADGRIWSQGLRDLHTAVGRTIATKLILDSHTLVPINPSFEEGLQSILDADDAIFGGTHTSAICTAFAPRGITVAECGS